MIDDFSCGDILRQITKQRQISLPPEKIYRFVRVNVGIAQLVKVFKQVMWAPFTVRFALIRKSDVVIGY